MATYSAGSASVNIVPDFSGAQTAIGKWFARQGDLKIKVKPDIDNAAMAGFKAKIQGQSGALKVDVDSRYMARSMVKALDFVLGTTLVEGALRKLFDVKPILMANLAGAGVMLAGALTQGLGTMAVGAAALLPGLVAGLVAPVAAVTIGLQGMGEAFKQIGAGGNPEKLAAAMKNLAPNARDFVMQMKALGPAWKALRLDVQNRLFAGLGDSFSNLANKTLPMLRPMLADIAGELGGVAKSLADTIATDSNVADFATTLGNVREMLRGVAANTRPLFLAFADIATVGSEFLPRFAKGFGDLATRFADFIQNARDTGALREFIETSLDGIRELVTVVGNLGSALFSVFRSAAVPGQQLVEILKMVTGDLSAFLKTDVAQSSLTTFFEGIASAVGALTPGIQAMAEALIIGVLPAMSGLADAIAPVVNTLLVQFADLLKELGPLFYPALANAISTALAALSPLMDVFTAIAKTVLPPVIDAINRLSPLFTELAEGIGERVTTAVGMLGDVLPGLVDAVVALAEAFVPLALGAFDLGVAILPPLVAVLGAVADVVGLLSPLLPVLALGFLGVKAAAGISALMGALATSLMNVAVAAATTSTTTAGLARRGLSEGLAGAAGRAESAVGRFGRSLPIVGAIIGGFAMVAQSASGDIDRWSAAILSGGQAAAQARKEMGDPSLWESLSFSIGNMFNSDGWSWGPQSEAMMRQSAEAARELWSAMTPLEQAQSKQAYWANELNWRMKEGNATSAEVEAAKRRQAYWSGEVERQERAQGEATKTATDRLKEQRDLILESANAQIAWERQQIRTTEAIAAFNSTAPGTKERASAELDLREAFTQSAEAAARKAEADNAGKAPAEIARLANEAYLTTLQGLAKQMGSNVPKAVVDLIASLEASSSVAKVVAGDMQDVGVKVQSIPGERTVKIDAPTEEQRRRLEALGYTIVTLPNGDVYVTASTGDAEAAMQRLVSKKREANVSVRFTSLGLKVPGGTVLENAAGNIVRAFATGGFMKAGLAQVVKPNTWRIIGDRVRDDEAYIPINGAPRSRAILEHTASAMGYGLVPNADGNYWTPPGMDSVFKAASARMDKVAGVRQDRLATPSGPSSVAGFINNGTVVTTDLDELSRKSRLGTRRALAAAGL